MEPARKPITVSIPGIMLLGTKPTTIETVGARYRDPVNPRQGKTWRTATD
jgi:hypothetical protein